MKTLAPTKLQYGLTIVELMVAMAIGMILMLGATGVLVTNQNAFRTSGSLSDIQENARIATEMIARDLRAAGSNPCTATDFFDRTAANLGLTVTNEVQTLKTNLSKGYTLENENVVGTGVINAVVADAQTISLTAGQTTFNITNQLKAGDLVVLCTNQAGYVLKVASASATSFTTTVGVPNIANLDRAVLVTNLTTRVWNVGNAGRNTPSLFRNGVEMVDRVAGLTVQQQGTAIKLTLILCSRNPEPQGIDTVVSLCPARHIERSVINVVQRRAS